MNGRTNLGLRVAAVIATSLALGTMAVAPAVAAGERDVTVVNTETVQVYTDATGKVASKRVYEQVDMTGNGTVELANPIETDGLRNLDEFGGFEVKDGQQVFESSIDGNERLRTVSDFGGDLPLEVDVVYVLDGKTVDPEDVVGESGELEVRYTVRNVTSAPEEVSFPDGSGGTVTKTVEVPIPLVGSLSTTTPSNFTDVQSEGANMAGDGKGGTKLSYTMTLFPPIGTDTAKFGFTATITDGVVPQTDISVLPVNPLNVPTFKNAANSYQGGADTGARLAQGAGIIDENLLKLRDGAAELLAGLIKLNDGTAKLSAGLAGEAAPGSVRLASGAARLDDGIGQLQDGTGELTAGSVKLRDGAGRVADGTQELNTGAGKLDAGANKLADGTGRLADGMSTASSGGQDLSAGLKLISDGLNKLSDQSTGLPAALDGIKALQDGVAKISAGLGAIDQPDTLLNGIARLESGLNQLAGNTPAPGLDDARDGVTLVKSGLNGALAPNGSLDQLAGGLQLVSAVFCPAVAPGTVGPGGVTCAQVLGQLSAGATKSRADLTAARDGLVQVEGGLNNALGALNTQLIPGATKLRVGGIAVANGVGEVQAGLARLYTGVAAAVQGVFQLRDGAAEAHAGSRALSNGLLQLNAGATQLDDGAGQLAAGTGELTDGTGRLADGAGQVADGTVELSAGANKLGDGATRLKDGSGQLADGAGELAAGLGTAADGSQQLADGMGQAAGGAPRLVDGAQRLSDEGTKQLIQAGEDTTQEYGELYATIAAGAERADADGMAFGAPEGAEGLTAYSFVVQGEDGEGGRNLSRGLGGALILGAGAGLFALRRRLI